MTQPIFSWLQAVAPTLMALAAMFLLYTYVAYPLLMGWLQRRRAGLGPVDCGPDPHSEDLPALTVLIAAHNAAGHIEDKLLNCLALDYPPEKLTVVIVSDGSDDATCSIVNRFANLYGRVRLIDCPVRRGKAACINDAVAVCNTELMVLTDTRQMFDPSAAKFLASHFADPSVGAVSGALEIAESGEHGVVDSAGAYWKMEKKLRAAEASVHSAIGVTGAIYALRRQAFLPIPVVTILDDVLIPMNAVMSGWRVLFDWRARAFDAPSGSEAQERARKIRTLAGNFQLLVLRPTLVTFSHNPVWWQFLSHKIFRVIAPLPLAIFLFANIALAPTGWFWSSLVVAQLLVYAVTLLPEGRDGIWNFWPMRLLKTVRGFVRLQWYAVLGFIWFLRNRQPQIWPTTTHRPGPFSIEESTRGGQLARKSSRELP